MISWFWHALACLGFDCQLDMTACPRAEVLSGLAISACSVMQTYLFLELISFLPICSTGKLNLVHELLLHPELF